MSFALGFIGGLILGCGLLLGAVVLVMQRLAGPIGVRPKGTVHHPHDAETEAMAQISETSISRLATHIQEGAQISPERAREEAEKMVAAAEGWGAPGW